MHSTVDPNLFFLDFERVSEVRAMQGLHPAAYGSAEAFLLLTQEHN